MPSAIAPAGELHERIEGFDVALLSRAERTRALDRFFSTASGHDRPGRFWKIDIEPILPIASAIDAAAGSVRIACANPRVIACDLRVAAHQHAALLARAFGTSADRNTKFGALADAFTQLGAFIYLPADVASDDPVAVTYTVPDGAALFPRTIVLAERGSRATVIERIDGGRNALVSTLTEIVAGENADVTYAAVQRLADDARCFSTRIARPARGARVAWATAELGAALAVCDLAVDIQEPGVQAQVTTIFFPGASQHIDIVSTIDHRVGDSTSETLVKSAATDAGQARYLGNIRIAPHAQGSVANLRDDALLLSKNAHIDSVPALEIGANDVKAYHGATVGALDREQIFYMESRGIEANAAERMIALGFFEPAIGRFPTETLRDELRGALAAKLK